MRHYLAVQTDSLCVEIDIKLRSLTLLVTFGRIVRVRVFDVNKLTIQYSGHQVANNFRKSFEA